MTDLIWSFSPWLAFLLGTRVTSLYGAVAAGVAVAVVVAVRAVARRRLHLLDVAGLSPLPGSGRRPGRRRPRAP